VPALPDGAGPASVAERSTQGTGVLTSFINVDRLKSGG
jgi:hypothetical protein